MCGRDGMEGDVVERWGMMKRRLTSGRPTELSRNLNRPSRFEHRLLTYRNLQDSNNVVAFQI